LGPRERVCRGVRGAKPLDKEAGRCSIQLSYGRMKTV